MSGEGPITGSATPAHLIEPWEKRKARYAAERKTSISREAAKLASVYRALKLPVRDELIPVPDPIPTPVPFIPFRVKRREHKAAGRLRRHDPRRSHKATGRPPGRPPSAALAAARAAGEKTYMGKPCPHGHSGLRYVIQQGCVRCLQLRRKVGRHG
jgi:hypothetical protein